MKEVTPTKQKALPSYPKVLTLGSTYTENALIGEVILQEKIDGSQFRWGWNADGSFHVCSKNQKVHVEAPGMFKEGVEHLLKLENAMVGCPNTVFFGEYLQKPKHNTLKYEKTPINHIVLFDAMANGKWLTRKALQQWVIPWDIDLIPEFAVGKMTIEDLMKFLETDSYLGNEKVEGVVIKNYGQLIEVNGVIRPLFTKYVNQEYRERHQKNPAQRSKRLTIQDWLGSWKNENRWLKALQHLTEAQTIVNEPKDIGALIKEVIRDLDEEETENIKNYLYDTYIRDIRNIATRGIPSWYKELLLKNIKEEK